MIDTDDMSKGRNPSHAGNAHEPHADVHTCTSAVARSCPFPVASGLLALPVGIIGGGADTSSKSHPDDYQEHYPDDGDDAIDGTPGGPIRDFGGRRFPVVGGKFITLVDHYWARLPHMGLDYTIYPVPTVPYAAKSGH
jgi:hypothetical protein